jgi:hypothetical protein
MRKSTLMSLVLVMLMLGIGLPGDAVSVPSPVTAATPGTSVITVDGRAAGPVYQGAGAVSAGASSRLLHDYPQPQRSQILDYLFKPGYGAQLQMLKVEIGSDANSTAGSEPTHERARGQLDCGRGYEWWLMHEARKRNPAIKLAGLEWGAPGWFRGGFWSRDNIDYQLNWLGCAARQGLKIDYMGGWNERGYEPGWFVAFKRALAQRFPGVRLIAADDCCRKKLWRVADSVATNPTLNRAVTDIGVHSACGPRTSYTRCASTTTARRRGQPLWMSENSALTHRVGAGPAARALNRAYLDAGMTGYLSWSAVSSWYANLPIADTGILLAEWPWSGHYEIGKTMWAFAHTTRFAQPGWHYIPSASGKLANGTTYVTRAAPGGGRFSTVIETLDAHTPSTIALRSAAGSAGPLSVWSSDLLSNNPRDHFVPAGTLPATGELTLRPGHVYTITNTGAGGKGTATSASTVDAQLPMPPNGTFEGTPVGRQARFFSDLNGSFQAVPCAGGRPGHCYEQQTTTRPIAWGPPGAMGPTTIYGDPRWWGDYQVSTRMLLRRPGSAELLGRVSTQATSRSTIGGYFLRVSSNNGWQLTSNDQYSGRSTIAAGPQKITTGRWHEVALRMRGTRLTVLLDGKPVRTVTDARQLTGNAGLRTDGFQRVQFDDLSVRPTGPPPSLVPRQRTRASATSAAGISRGYDYPPGNAVDGRPESNWKPAPGQRGSRAITLDLGGRERIGGVWVQPQHEVAGNTPITAYRILASQDGRTYRQVAKGQWPAGWTSKTAPLPRPVVARFVRLAVSGAAESHGTPGIGELRVIRG